MREYNLDLEKILEKIGSKYEAVVRMSITANKITDGEVQVERVNNEKITTTAMKQYVKDSIAAMEKAKE